jgi:cystathionine gamma-lyase
MHAETQAVRTTLTPAAPGEPLHASPVFASTFHTPGDPADSLYSYARSENPTGTALEAAIAGLEGAGAHVRVLASGMAAVDAVFRTTLRPGDTVVLPEHSYFGARNLLREQYVPLGVELRLLQTSQLTSAEHLAGARLVWLETPSNPRLEVTDLAQAIAASHDVGALAAVDNTTATPLGQQPLRFGADFSVCSDSKAMSGHSDLLLGHVASASLGLIDRLHAHRNLTGAVAGPMEAWLLLRSLATLPLRLERASANALALAELLASHPAVQGVVYPGLPNHPGHAIAKAQMEHFGPVLGFDLGPGSAGKAAAERFLHRACLVTETTSFGGITTTAERRQRWGHDGLSDGFIRLSAGCEHIGDLLNDLRAALSD